MIGLTGGRGVLGARIRDALTARGLEVLCFDGDVRDREAIADWIAPLDGVVHAAAMVPVQQVEADLGAALLTNVVGTINVAQGAARSGCRMIYISTSHVYRSSDTALAEDDPLMPASLYGLTKLQGEQWVNTLVPDALIVRVFSYFDARQQPSYLVPNLLRRISAAETGASLDIYGADCIRDIADARWLGERCAILIAGTASGSVNCCTGQGERVADIARRLAAAIGREDIRWNPVQEGRPNSLVGAPDRLIELGGRFAPFDLDAALAVYARTAAPRETSEMHFA